MPRSELREVFDEHELRNRHDQKRKQHEHTDQLLIEVRFSAKYDCPHEHDAQTNNPERGNRRQHGGNRSGITRLFSLSQISSAAIAVTQSLRVWRTAICTKHRLPPLRCDPQVIYRLPNTENEANNRAEKLNCLEMLLGH